MKQSFPGTDLIMGCCPKIQGYGAPLAASYLALLGAVFLFLGGPSCRCECESHGLTLKGCKLLKGAVISLEFLTVLEETHMWRLSLQKRAKMP